MISLFMPSASESQQGLLKSYLASHLPTKSLAPPPAMLCLKPPRTQNNLISISAFPFYCGGKLLRGHANTAVIDDNNHD